jgi:Glycosyltransferase family 10 (fucosyltransferase) C-term
MMTEAVLFKVRVVPSSWWPKGRSFSHDGLLYSDGITQKAADALLALYDPTEELLHFKGPKLWYTHEPMWHPHFRRHPIGRQLVKSLLPSEWVYFANPHTAYRVRSLTFAHTLNKVRANGTRRTAAVATVNYFGGPLWFLKPHIWLRNRMILESRVELFGRRTAWENFTHFPKIWRRGVPDNFRGETNLSHLQDDFCEFLSRYKVYVCLENSCEPGWFTEKLVNAARAGCVPVYHAHPTVAERFLNGAKWVDPADHKFNAKRTIEYALAADQSEFQKANDSWLESGILEETGYLGFWNRIHTLIKAKLTKEPPAPMSADKCRSFSN